VKRLEPVGVRLALCLAAVSLVWAPGAWASTSTQASPTVAFATPGSKQVSLTACAGLLCDSVSQSVLVLDPHPAVTSSGALAATVEAGQMVRLDGVGTGKPPLAFSWQVTPLVAPSFTVSGNPGWWDTAGLAPGVYAVELTISNTAGSAAGVPFAVTLLPPQGSGFYTLAPCRAYDSRTGLALTSGSSRTVGIAASGCGVPATARAVAVNVTVVDPTGVGSATLYPGNYPQSVASTIDFAAGITRANTVLMPLSTDGVGTFGLAVDVANGGSTHVLMDVTGYFLAP
jgi:hypothetical protein